MAQPQPPSLSSSSDLISLCTLLSMYDSFTAIARKHFLFNAAHFIVCSDNKQDQVDQKTTMLEQWALSSFFFLNPTAFAVGFYRSLRKPRAVVCGWVSEPVRDVSVTAWVCTDHEILCLPCLFHVLGVKLEFWNFVYAFLASIPTCMHGFIMIRISLIP